MTPDELAEIRAREQAATPGPWTWSAGMIEAPRDADGGMEAVLWAANIPGEYDDDNYASALGACGQHVEEHAADNLAFLAHARADIPKLLARVAELEVGRELLERRLHSVWLRAQSIASVAAFQLQIDATDHAWLTVNADVGVILAAMRGPADDAA